MDDTLNRRQRQSEEELRQRGLLYDVDDDGNRLPYEPADDRDDARHDFEDEPQPGVRPCGVKHVLDEHSEPPVKQPQAPRRREVTADELYERGVLYGDEDHGRSGISVDPKRPYNFEKNRYH